MAKSEIIAGLDIGSSQICCAIGRLSEETGTLEVLSGAKTAVQGS